MRNGMAELKKIRKQLRSGDSEERELHGKYDVFFFFYFLNTFKMFLRIIFTLIFINGHMSLLSKLRSYIIFITYSLQIARKIFSKELERSY